MVREPKSLRDMVIPYEDMLTVFQKVIMLHYIYGFYDLTSDKFEYIGQMYDIPFGIVAMLNNGGAKHYSKICPYNLPIRKKYAQQPRRNSK